MKKVFISLFIISLSLVITGCGKSSDGTFTMTCVTPKDNSAGFETQNTITYTFNENQLATMYTVTTSEKFDDLEVYNIYKKAQEETTVDGESENVKYSLESDDEKMSLLFSMTITGLDSVTSEEEKEALKASKILSRNEELGSTCTLKGINKKDLK